MRRNKKKKKGRGKYWRGNRKRNRNLPKKGKNLRERRHSMLPLPRPRTTLSSKVSSPSRLGRHLEKTLRISLLSPLKESGELLWQAFQASSSGI